MRKTIISALLFSLFISCEFNEVNKNAAFPLGTYRGQFIRSSPNVKYAPSNVMLTFTTDGFSGDSDMSKYPAICNGSYTITGQEIEFTNSCVWTAEFDWTYILSGKFEIKLDSSRLEMTKVTGTQTDYYKLELQ